MFIKEYFIYNIKNDNILSLYKINKFTINPKTKTSCITPERGIERNRGILFLKKSYSLQRRCRCFRNFSSLPTVLIASHELQNTEIGFFVHLYRNIWRTGRDEERLNPWGCSRAIPNDPSKRLNLVFSRTDLVDPLVKIYLK